VRHHLHVGDALAAVGALERDAPRPPPAPRERPARLARRRAELVDRHGGRHHGGRAVHVPRRQPAEELRRRAVPVHQPELGVQHQHRLVQRVHDERLAPERGLGAPPLGDVHRRAHRGRAPAVVRHPAAQLHLQHRPVLALHERRRDGPLERVARQAAREPAPHPGVRLRREQLRDGRHAQELVHRVPGERRHARVGVHESLVLHHVHAVDRLVDHRAKRSSARCRARSAVTRGVASARMTAYAGAASGGGNRAPGGRRRA
jgi:hypothetical protein